MNYLIVVGSREKRWRREEREDEDRHRKKE
jgi:hypothetical protein